MSFKQQRKQHKLLIKLLAKMQEYNYEWLAKRSGVSIATLYNWDRGDVYAPRISTMEKVGKVVGMELEWGESRIIRSAA